MLQARVGRSKAVLFDGQVFKYSIRLDAEIPVVVDDSEAVLEKVGELFQLADEALAVEIDRDRNHASAESEKRATPTPTSEVLPKTNVRSAPLPINQPPYVANQSPRSTAAPTQSATTKQQQYVTNLAKRKGLSADALCDVITQVVGSAKKLADLTKREAGAVIDQLSALQPEASR